MGHTCLPAVSAQRHRPYLNMDLDVSAGSNPSHTSTTPYHRQINVILAKPVVGEGQHQVSLGELVVRGKGAQQVGRACSPSWKHNSISLHTVHNILRWLYGTQQRSPNRL